MKYLLITTLLISVSCGVKINGIPSKVKIDAPEKIKIDMPDKIIIEHRINVDNILEICRNGNPDEYEKCIKQWTDILAKVNPPTTTN